MAPPRLGRAMVPRAALLLARAWHRGYRRWWWATAASMGLVLALILVVLGTFRGLGGATEDRVADFYTGDLRITVGEPGAAPAQPFDANATAALAQLEAAAGGGRLVPRLESQFAMSRRSLLEAYLEEDERYTIDVPGGAEGDNEFYAIGILVGLPFGTPGAVEGIRAHLVAGGFPGAQAAGDGEVQVLMSAGQFRRYLSEGERAALSGWPPAAPELAAFRFEVTTATVDDSGAFRDLIRAPARVVGLFDTRLDALDTFTLVAPIEDVRRLAGEPGDAPVANVLVLQGGDAEAVGRVAAAHGWHSEDRGAFAERYVGQLIRVLEALSVLLASLFFLLPLFLVGHGVRQQLQMHGREVAVCQAIGVRTRTLAGAMLALVGRSLLGGLLLAAAAVAAAGTALARLLPRWEALPMPLAFRLDPLEAALVGAAAVVSTLLALATTLWRHARRDLAADLRTF